MARAHNERQASKKPKRLSRAERWAAALSDARAAKEEIEAAQAKLEEAFSALRDLKGEYEEWRDNLPENLQSSPLGEKLEAVCDLDFDQELDLSPLDVIDEADGVDLPLGFGRD